MAKSAQRVRLEVIDSADVQSFGEAMARGWLEECFPSTDSLPDKDNDPDGTQWIKSVGAGALGTAPVSGNFGFAHTVEHGCTTLHPQE